MSRVEEFQTGLRHNQWASAQVSPSGYISNMVTHYDHRGEGHGTDLLQEITNNADAAGQELLLNARADLHPWYGRHGFTVDPEGFALGGLPQLRRPPRHI